MKNKSINNLEGQDFFQHEMNLNNRWFNEVKDENKTVEIRTNDEKRQLINIGDIIKFIDSLDENNIIYVEVIHKTNHINLKNAIKSGRLKYVLPGFNKISEGVDYYYSFNGYKDKEDKYGIVNLYLKLIN
jgi:ASC-1-like (ASCH) protein